MTAIITEKFRQHNATQFFESFSETSGNTYYLFVGKATPFTTGTSGGTDGAPPTPSDGVGEEFYVWDDMIAAKQITSSFISFALPRRNWVNGTIYDQYDHAISTSNPSTSGSTNLYDSTFYFMTTDYRVYKVIDNNAGTAYSGSAPTSESNTPFESGGYVLQYMYSLSSSEIEKYLTTDFMPVTTNSTVSSAATDGNITSVKVTAGSGYTNGTYYAAVYGDGTSQGTSSGAIIRITVANGSIKIFGLTAGSDTTVHAAGAGYTYGKVNLATGYTFSDASLSTAANIGGSGGAINLVISPKGGHGFDAVSELGGHYLMMNTTLTQSEGDDFTVANDFRRVGLVVDPYLNGGTTLSTLTTARQTYALKLTSISGTFDADEKISQASTGAIGKVVDWDSSLGILYYQQERFGDYGTSGTTGGYVAFSGANLVTGATSAAYGTPDASSDSAVTLAGGAAITFTDGYANPELEPDSGNIIYIENRKPISRSSDQTEDIKLIVEF
jgi:hypothetical protein